MRRKSKSGADIIRAKACPSTPLEPITSFTSGGAADERGAGHGSGASKRRHHCAAHRRRSVSTRAVRERCRPPAGEGSRSRSRRSRGASPDDCCGHSVMCLDGGSRRNPAVPRLAGGGRPRTIVAEHQTLSGHYSFVMIYTALACSGAARPVRRRSITVPQNRGRSLVGATAATSAGLNWLWTKPSTGWTWRRSRPLTMSRARRVATLRDHTF